MMHRTTYLSIVLLTPLLGCGDEVTIAEDAGADTLVDTSGDASTDVPDAALDVADVLDSSDDVAVDALTDGSGSDAETDADGSGLPPDACETGDTYVYVISMLGFAREEPRGTSPGLNLDGHATRRGEGEGCNIQDMTSPDGVPGIDNNFAKLLPALEAVGGDAIEGLIQAAINEGDLLLVLELSHVDDLANDRCIDVTVLRGTGLPLVGADDRIVSGQTFDRALDLPSTTIEGVEIVDGTVVAGPFDLTIPVQILGTALTVSPRDSYVSARLSPDGITSAVLGGALLLTDIQAILEEVGGETVVNVAADLIVDAVDLRVESEQCDAISVALVFSATTGFLFE